MIDAVSRPAIPDRKNLHLCFHCVGEAYLRAEMEKEGKSEECAYCGEVRNGYALGLVAEKVEKAFEQHFVQTPIDEWDFNNPTVVQTILYAADVEDLVAEDIQAILEDAHYSHDAAKAAEEWEFKKDSHYTEKGTNDVEWQQRWQSFEHALKTEARFFDRRASDHLGEVFEGIADLQTHDGRPMIVTAGPGTKYEFFYRARVFQSEPDLEKAMARPDKELSPPPSKHAPAGRMNARGISVFYGSTDPKVALREVRPPVGSDVLVGKFDVVRELRLLDLTALPEAIKKGSIFDPTYAGQLDRIAFLGSLTRRMTRAVLPDDEALDYLPTQAVADFLATHPTLDLDGILFPSRQAGGDGLNVILFHKSSRVDLLDLPKGSKVNVTTGMFSEEPGDYYYSVTEKVPPPLPPGEPKPKPNILDLRYEDILDGLHTTPREVSLRVDAQSVRLHNVEAVEVQAREYGVRRDRRITDASGDLP